MSDERNTNPADPTAERAADQYTPSAGGLTGGHDDVSRGRGNEQEATGKEKDEAGRDRLLDDALGG